MKMNKLATYYVLGALNAPIIASMVAYYVTDRDHAAPFSNRLEYNKLQAAKDGALFGASQAFFWPVLYLYCYSIIRTSYLVAIGSIFFP
jgi:hypothetical protein